MLVVLLIIIIEGVPVIENPGSSIISQHNHFKLLVKMLMAKGIRNLGCYRLFLFLLVYVEHVFEYLAPACFVELHLAHVKVCFVNLCG